MDSNAAWNQCNYYTWFFLFSFRKQGGGGRYNVETGRKDGFVSLATNVNLRGPDIPVAQSIATFAKKGLNATDMVYLLGTYTPHFPHRYVFKLSLDNYVLNISHFYLLNP